LSGILGMLDLLLETPLSQDQGAYVHSARACAQDLLEQLNAALEFTALCAGRLQLHEAEFNFPETLWGMVTHFQSVATARGLRLEPRLNSAIPPILAGDAVRLREVLSWMIYSAIKSTRSGAVILEISGGRGKDREFLLEASVQGGTGRARQNEVGLMLARALVELMGGRLTIEPVGETATRRHMSVPLHVPGAPATHTVGGRRVLVVEDNTIAEQIVSHVLQQGGYDVRSVRTGEAAVAEAQQARYDLVLMDLEMPGMDGLETTAAIRSLPGWQEIPILALTAHFSEESRTLCLERGMSGFLAKPISPEDLLAAVSAAAGGR
jgi:CheY-like chemotaxis protein